MPNPMAMMAKDKLYTLADAMALMGTVAKPGRVVSTTEEVGDFMLANKVIRRKGDAAKLFDTSLLDSLR